MAPHEVPPFGDGPDDADLERAFGPSLSSADIAVPPESRGDHLGWLPPEARDWRHPSEVFSNLHAKVPVPVPGRPGPDRDGDADAPGRARGFLVVGMAGTAFVVIGVVVLLSANLGISGPGARMGSRPVSTDAITVPTKCCTLLPVAARNAEAAMVTLEISTNHGVEWGCGLAVAPGNVVVTTINAVHGARSITAVTGRGRHERAWVTATDASSDIALVRVSGHLPVAQFVDDRTLAPGGPVMVMAPAMPERSSQRATVRLAHSTVQSVATTMAGGTASGLAGIDVMPSAMAPMPGAVLLAPQGRVVGILDTSAKNSEGIRTTVFLPSQLIVGVVGDLAASDHVRHGWLDVMVEDASPAALPSEPLDFGQGPVRFVGGASVTHVETHSPAEGTLEAGDVILAVNGEPVRSAAELHSRLYVLAPGAQVQLLVDREGVILSADVLLSSSP